MCTAERTTMTKITPSVDVEGEQHVNGALIFFLSPLDESGDTSVGSGARFIFK